MALKSKFKCMSIECSCLSQKVNSIQNLFQDFDMVEDADGKIDTEGFEAELEEMLQNQ